MYESWDFMTLSPIVKVKSTKFNLKFIYLPVKI